MLAKFKGNLLLVDGGSEFNEVVRKQGLQPGGCWSQCRTYFYNARHFHTEEANLAWTTIRDLFLIEHAIHGGDLEHIRTPREQQARLLVDGFSGGWRSCPPSPAQDRRSGSAIR